MNFQKPPTRSFTNSGPEVLKKVGSLVYCLEILPVMQIHPVISIAQLESILIVEDPYGRPRNIIPPVVTEGKNEKAKNSV